MPAGVKNRAPAADTKRARLADAAPRAAADRTGEGTALRVLVVDDSAFMRTALSRMINEDADLEVVDTARNGQDAIEKARRLRPDIVTLDVEMPVMDGLAALPELLRKPEDGGPPPAVLMCSSLTSRGSEVALEALKHGASDVIAKDSSFASAEIVQIRDLLVAKLRAIGRARGARTKAERAGVVLTEKPLRLDPAATDLVLIGSSTGAPPVLETIIHALPPELPVPVVVAQHMPAIFTKSMAQRLDQGAALTVVHADADMPLIPGCVFIIQGGMHGLIRRAGTRRYTLGIEPPPADALYKPSVDALLYSAAAAVRNRALACVLTGMGDDGAAGARALRDAGSRVIAQNAETCVVYGMPKAVSENGAAEAALPPEAITQTIGSLAPRGENPARTDAARLAG